MDRGTTPVHVLGCSSTRARGTCAWSVRLVVSQHCSDVGVAALLLPRHRPVLLISLRLSVYLSTFVPDDLLQVARDIVRLRSRASVVVGRRQASTPWAAVQRGLLERSASMSSEHNSGLSAPPSMMGAQGVTAAAGDGVRTTRARSRRRTVHRGAEVLARTRRSLRRLRLRSRSPARTCRSPQRVGQTGRALDRGTRRNLAGLHPHPAMPDSIMQQFLRERDLAGTADRSVITRPAWFAQPEDGPQQESARWKTGGPSDGPAEVSSACSAPTRRLARHSQHCS